MYSLETQRYVFQNMVRLLVENSTQKELKAIEKQFAKSFQKTLTATRRFMGRRFHLRDNPALIKAMSDLIYSNDALFYSLCLFFLRQRWRKDLPVEANLDFTKAEFHKSVEVILQFPKFELEQADDLWLARNVSYWMRFWFLCTLGEALILGIQEQGQEALRKFVYWVVEVEKQVLYTLFYRDLPLVSSQGYFCPMVKPKKWFTSLDLKLVEGEVDCEATLVLNRYEARDEIDPTNKEEFTTLWFSTMLGVSLLDIQRRFNPPNVLELSQEEIFPIATPDVEKRLATRLEFLYKHMLEVMTIKDIEAFAKQCLGESYDSPTWQTLWEHLRNSVPKDGLATENLAPETQEQAPATPAVASSSEHPTVEPSTSESVTQALNQATEALPDAQNNPQATPVPETTPSQISAEPAPTPTVIQSQVQAKVQYVYHNEAPRQLVFDGQKNQTMAHEPVWGDHRRFLGRLMQQGTYYNFAVHAEERNGEFLPVTLDEAKNLFPKFGAFNLRSSARKRLTDGAYFVLDLDLHTDLRANTNVTTNKRREDYEYMVDYELLQRQKRIYGAQEFGWCLVVHPLEDEANLEKDVFVSLNEREDIFFTQGVDFPVLLKVGDKFLGPVPLRRNIQQRPYVNFSVRASQNLINGFMAKPGQKPTTMSWDEYNSSDEERRDHNFVNITLVNTLSLKPIRYDVLTDEGLLRKLITEMTQERTQREELFAWTQNEMLTPALFSDDKAVREARYARVMNLIYQDKENRRFFEDISKLVSSSFFSVDQDSEFFVDLVKKVLDNQELQRQLEKHKDISNMLHGFEVRAEEARRQAEEIEQDLEQKRRDYQEEVQTKHKKLRLESSRLEAQIEKDKKKITRLNECADLEALITNMQGEVRAMDEQKRHIENEMATIGDRLKESVREYRKYAFDGMLANQFLEAASQWTQNNENEKRTQRHQQILAIKPKKRSREQLINQIKNAIKAERPYSDNEILNIFIALTQNFLTVFSGPPGLGKTSMCSLVANVLGLHLVADKVEDVSLWGSKQELSRFVPISVERGWTSKRDFVGYWNPLTKSFESVDMRRFEAFRQLDCEARNQVNDWPFLMLLDEANLSPMEYYWADFMNLCDAHSAGSQISLGDKQPCYIPETLRFVATINNDHTTETLSPRLIDRAMVVTLPELGWRGLMQDDTSVVDVTPDEMVSWADLQAIFGPRPIKMDRQEIEECLEAVFTQMAKGGFHLSQRVHRATQNYISAAKELFEKDDYPSKAAVAMDFAIAQKVLPHIEGHGEAFHQWLEELQSVLSQYGLEKSKSVVDRIITVGNAKMKYYRFFS